MKQMNGSLLQVLGVMAVLGASPVAGSESKTFKVCADPHNPPFSTMKGDGFENRIAELFAKALDQKLEYTWFPQRLGFIRNTLKGKNPDSEEYKCDVVMGVPTGYELAATTQTYYRSTYALVYRKGKGLDQVKTAGDLDTLAPETRSKLRIAMLDGAPGTTWLLNHGLINQGIPYQSMTGDAQKNTAMLLADDFKADKLDMVIIWGPIAGYIVNQSPEDYAMIPMKSEKGLKLEFPISMGVRIPDKTRKQQLDELIQKNAADIESILREFHVPLVGEEANPTPAAR